MPLADGDGEAVQLGDVDLVRPGEEVSLLGGFVEGVGGVDIAQQLVADPGALDGVARGSVDV